jgi:hypothetical protein
MVRLKMEKIEWELIPENKLREWAEVLKFDIDIDFSRRDPALSSGHMFSAVPRGYHWSATPLDYHSGMAWIVYFESGTTCYEDVTNQAGHILPVRKPKVTKL